MGQAVRALLDTAARPHQSAGRAQGQGANRSSERTNQHAGESDMLTSTASEQTLNTINLCREVEIAAPIEIAFEALLEEIGPASEMPGGKPMPMVLEPRPGGRWYRDLGNNAGHLWGH